MNWIKIKEGDIELVHHSTSSLIEIIVYDDDRNYTLWVDYVGFENLKKAILKISDEQ